MGKKMDAKAAALAAAQGSGAVFEALADEPETVAADPRHDEPRADDAPAPNHDKDPMMNAQTFAPAIDAAAEKMRNMMNGAGGTEMMERTTKLGQEAAELARANLEAMAASARIAAQNAGTLTQDIAAASRKSFEDASGAIKGFAEAKSPTELLRHVEGLELVDLPNSEECCGFGGTFSVKMPEVSSAMVSDKVRHIKDTQAEYVTAGDSSCLMNIAGAMSRQHQGIRAVHMAEILASTKEHPLTPTSAAYKKEKML